MHDPARRVDPAERRHRIRALFAAAAVLLGSGAVASAASSAATAGVGAAAPTSTKPSLPPLPGSPSPTVAPPPVVQATTTLPATTIATTAPPPSPPTSPPPTAPASPAPSGEYVTVTDDWKVLTMEVPTAWPYVVTAPFINADRTLRPAVSAITVADFETFLETSTAAGVVYEAYPRTEFFDPLLANVPQLDCVDGGRTPFNDGVYVGTMQAWNFCGGGSARMFVVVANAPGATFTAGVWIKTLTPADEAYATHVLGSLSFDPAAPLPTVTVPPTNAPATTVPGTTVPATAPATVPVPVPPLTTVPNGGVPPTVADGGVPPTVADGGVPPTVADGGVPPTVADGGVPPTVADGGVPPTVADGGVPPTVPAGLPVTPTVPETAPGGTVTPDTATPGTTTGAATVTLTDDLGRLSVTVPATWSDVNLAPAVDEGDATSHPAITATVDVDAFNAGYAASGVYLREIAPLPDPTAYVTSIARGELATDCTDGGVAPYESATFTGAIHTWNDCDGTTYDVTVAALNPASSPESTVFVIIQTGDAETGVVVPLIDSITLAP